jgi:hypothetical protein
MVAASLRTLRVVMVVHCLAIVAGYFITRSDQLAPGDISFGFGPYIASILSTGQFQSCDIAGDCRQASRMPVFPYLAAASFALTGTQLGLLLVKSIVCAIGIYYYVLPLWSRLGKVNQAAFCVVALNPLFLKHLWTPHYEEFLTGGLLLLYVLSLHRFASRRAAVDMYVNAALASTLYLTKATYMPLLLVSVVFQISCSGKLRSTAIALALTVLPFAAWAVHLQSTGTDRIYGTSWDGENFYRGVSPLAAQLYPRVSLDHMFHTTEFIAADGEHVALDGFAQPILEARAATGEWHWHEIYMHHAIATIKTQPGEVLAFLGKKAWYTLFGLHDKLRMPMDPERTTVVIVIFAIVRAVWLYTTVKVVVSTNKASVAAYALLSAALLTPFIIGFAYERHLTCALAALILAGLALQAEKLQPDGIPSRRRGKAITSC